MNENANNSGISPMHYNVLVRPDDVKTQTAGGIILPDEIKEKDAFGRTEGTLVAISPLAFTYAEWPVGARKPQVGDRVVFPRYQAVEMKGRDGGKFWMMKDEAVAGVIEP